MTDAISTVAEWRQNPTHNHDCLQVQSAPDLCFSALNLTLNRSPPKSQNKRVCPLRCSSPETLECRGLNEGLIYSLTITQGTL